MLASGHGERSLQIRGGDVSASRARVARPQQAAQAVELGFAPALAASPQPLEGIVEYLQRLDDLCRP